LKLDNDHIFVSIASYRDLQLVPTVEDLIAKADEPLLLRFGICWQHGAEISSLPFAGDPRFQILDVDWRQSRGACWARAEIMKLWRGEQWFLQVDSHCRFAPGWDTKLIVMAERTGSPKPILSTYANTFTPSETLSDTHEVLSGPPQLMALETFTEDGIPTLKPLTIPNSIGLTRPMRARFLSAGFLFAPGKFVVEVPYDPQLYFFGEEISLSLRAFTSGYDLFHPMEAVVWHDYVRSYATRHWEDHAEALAGLAAVGEMKAGQVHPWGELDRRSRDRVKGLLIGKNPQAETVSSAAGALESFGLGNERTRADFENYAGLSFHLRKAQDYTRRALEPPNPSADPDWPDHIYTWLVRVAIDAASLPRSAFHEPGFWMVAIKDENRNEIYRRDFTRIELNSLTGTESQVMLICEIQSGIIPVFWTVWPFSRAGGWGTILEGCLSNSDFAIIKDEADAPMDK
jgi:hypothetical protein